jgi:hypothetical protein
MNGHTCYDAFETINDCTCCMYAQFNIVVKKFICTRFCDPKVQWSYKNIGLRCKHKTKPHINST